MSRKFIQLDAWDFEESKDHEDELVLTIFFKKDKQLAPLPWIKDVFPGMFVPKEEEEGETWFKVTLDCIINFLNNFLQGQHNFNDTGDNPNLNVDGINLKLIIIMRLLSNIQQSCINSKSWLSDTIKPYDIDKMESDLSFLLDIVKSLRPKE